MPNKGDKGQGYTEGLGRTRKPTPNSSKVASGRKAGGVGTKRPALYKTGKRTK